MKSSDVKTTVRERCRCGAEIEVTCFFPNIDQSYGEWKRKHRDCQPAQVSALPLRNPGQAGP